MSSDTRKRVLVLPLFLLLLSSVGFTQTVNVFVHEFIWQTTNFLPDHNLIRAAYTNYFSTVNVSRGAIGTTMGSLNSYDVVYICELDFGGSNNLMSAAQRGVVENYISNGGHVVWVGENNSSGGAPGTDHCMIAISNLWGVNLSRTPGTGNPTMPYHGAGGPGGLTSGVASVPTTSSYDYFTGPATLPHNTILANSGGTGSCSQSSIQGMAYIFPEPNICNTNDGTMLLYGEVQMWSTYAGTAGHVAHYRNVANLHHIMLTGNQSALDLLNANWIPNNACPAPAACSVILSADIRSFKVKHHGPGTGKLMWETASELFNDGFEVQHRFESETFDQIGFVEGKGISDEHQYYDFMQHNLAAGTHFFRLKQFDENGSFSYSEVRELEIQPAEAVAIYPTLWQPETEVVTLYSPDMDRVQLELIAMDGKVVRRVYSGPVDAESFTEIPIQTEDLATGRYWLAVKGQHGQFGERILVRQ